jgi:hypothetical protein
MNFEKSKKHFFRYIGSLLAIGVFIPVIFIHKAYSQPELAPWGNITGIRINGQLMEFESSLRVVGKDWSQISFTGKEKQRPKYTREGNSQLVTTHIDSLYFTEKVEDAAPGIAKVDVQALSKGEMNITGAFFSIEIAGDDYTGGMVQLVDPAAMPLNIEAGTQNDYFGFASGGVRFISNHRKLEVSFDEPTGVIIKKENIKGKAHIRLYVPVHLGNIITGQSFHKTFTIKVSGEIDKNPVNLSLNTAVTGRAFDGFGGNFRLQNPKGDPQVIEYSLKNLRVAWGRVELPWAFWQPVKDSNPIDTAQAEKLNPRVLKAMEMAGELGKMGIPLILSAWFPPRWAIVGEPSFRPRPDGVWGNPLDKDRMNEIYKSITDYIIYLKKNYGVEIKLFSFNESDLGINIRQTGQEHADLIKGLGAYFASKGLRTKMLLGDNSDANTYDFIYPAMADPAALPYIGAISFHSWRGWEKETLEKWADAAGKLNLPLIVGEGSIDAAAWNYPAIFQEQTYALEEINLYTRIMAICQPLTILQWQLTSDYSPLAGGGIFGNDEPLHPTQRFWNLKQLASTPKGLFAMPITSDRPGISCAALGNNKNNKYSIQLVNNGATREVVLSGLPKKVKSLRIFVTDKERAMKEGQRIPVSDGKAMFTLDSVSYTSLVTE